jgi:hypothetical protein
MEVCGKFLFEGSFVQVTLLLLLLLVLKLAYPQQPTTVSSPPITQIKF